MPSGTPRPRAGLAASLATALGLYFAAAITGPAAANTFSTATGGLKPISAQSTGNVEIDFPAGQDGIITLVNPRYPTNDPESFIAANNLSTGWSIKDIRLFYEPNLDELHVGLNFFGVAGDADGNGDGGSISSAAASQGALDVPSLGGRESITVGFDFDHNGRPDIVAGVPGDKTQAGPGIDGFSVASFKNTGVGLAYSYGSPLTDHIAGLLFDPTAAHPDFEFLITNFSKLPGYNPKEGYGLIAFAGTPDDIYEEEGVLFPEVSFGEPIQPPGGGGGGPNQVPEPATIAAWGLAGFLALAYRKRRRGASEVGNAPNA